MSAVSSTTPDPTRSAPALRLAALRRASRDLPLVQLTVLVAVFAYGAATVGGFSAWTSVRSMLLIAAFLGLAALGQTILVLLGHLDLSVPGFIGFGNVMTAILYGQHHWSMLSVLVVTIAAAILGGAISGLICHRLGVQSILVTLGMNFIVLGILGVMAIGGVTGTGPGWLTRFATVSSTTFGVGIPPLVAFWLVVAVVAGFVLRRTAAGRRVYLVGSNPRAADLAIVGTGRVVTFAFALSATAAAVTGVLLTGFSGSGSVGIGSPYLFTSLTAVIIGGTSIRGARGDYWRTVIGALMLTVIDTVLLAHGYSDAAQRILSGAIIFVAVLAYGREPRLRDRL